jgi:hypothetical protein
MVWIIKDGCPHGQTRLMGGCGLWWHTEWHGNRPCILGVAHASIPIRSAPDLARASNGKKNTKDFRLRSSVSAAFLLFPSSSNGHISTFLYLATRHQRGPLASLPCLADMTDTPTQSPNTLQREATRDSKNDPPRTMGTQTPIRYCGGDTLRGHDAHGVGLCESCMSYKPEELCIHCAYCNDCCQCKKVAPPRSD